MSAFANLVSLSFLPAWAKGALLVLAVWNIRAFPFVWHVRVLRPVVRLYLMRKDAQALIRKTRGQDPTKIRIVLPSWRVTLDQVDYNRHKSNSTYAADCDIARSNVAVDFFAPFLAVGGMLPIAATTHRFIHELQPLQKYDVEVSYGGFGEKWTYAVLLFVTHPKKGSKAKQTQAVPPTPASGSTSGAASPAVKKLVETRLSDGAVIHAISVSVFCFKLGRLTIPPAVVVSMCAYGDSTNYDRFLKLHAAGPRATVKYLKGGWKEDPEAVLAVEGFAKQGAELGEKGDAMRKILEEYGVTAPVV